MNKQRYIALLQNPSLIAKEDIPDLEELILQFPYCQNAHILLAKIQTINGSMHAAKLTRKAALYTSDRNKLKQLVSSSPEPVVTKPYTSPIIQQIPESIVPAVVYKEPLLETEPAPFKPFSSDVKQEADKQAGHFLEELEKNLKELRESRARAAGVLPPFSKEEVERINNNPEQINTVAEDTVYVPEIPVSQEITDLTQKEAERPIFKIEKPEVDKSIPKNDVLDLILSFDDRVKDYFDINEYVAPKPEAASDIIPDEIKVPEEHITPNEGMIALPFDNKDWNLEESRMEETAGSGNDSILLQYLEYIREQKNKKQKPDKKREKSIISRFIQKNPMISPLSPTQASNEEDESSDGTGMSADLSKTFALLLEKQGKVDKAIRVYEELILKNPEKNSYFATRIQELKKKNNLQ